MEVSIYVRSSDSKHTRLNYYASEKTSGQHATAIKAMEEQYDIQFIFIDSAAAQTRYDWAMEYDLATTNASKSVLDGIAYVQMLIEQNNLIVDPKCERLLQCLDQYRWDPNENLLKERPVHDEYSHMADALRYALYTYQTGVGGV